MSDKIPGEDLRKRYWKEEKQSKSAEKIDYIPLEERSDQSWRDKVIVLEPSQH